MAKLIFHPKGIPLKKGSSRTARLWQRLKMRTIHLKEHEKLEHEFRFYYKLAIFSVFINLVLGILLVAKHNQQFDPQRPGPVKSLSP